MAYTGGMSRRRRQTPDAEPTLDNDVEPPASKSARKRQMQALQKLGEKLTELNPDQLEEMALSPALRTAITDYQRISSREARRRQRQFIGGVMRDEDAERIARDLERLTEHHAAAKQAHRQLEQWRQRLLDDPDALTAFVDAYPATDVQTLRTALRRVQSARVDTQRRAAARALYRLLSTFCAPNREND